MFFSGYNLRGNDVAINHGPLRMLLDIKIMIIKIIKWVIIMPDKQQIAMITYQNNSR